jgi:hypothetical protein
MRYREFVINIPINIRFGENGEVDVDMDNSSGDNDENEVMVPPLQQKLELAKAGLGKESKVANELLQDEFLDEDSEQED